MTQILLDTNVVLDLLAKRYPFYQNAAELFTLADRGVINLAVSSLTIANTSYILNKSKSVKEIREILKSLRLLAKVLPLDDKIVDLALNNEDFRDFEDALQFYSALNNGLEIIVTRDIKDFKHSTIPVMSPDEYLKSR